MAEVSREVIYRLALDVLSDVTSAEQGLSELKAEMRAFRGHMISLQQDVHNIHAILARRDTRLDRIEKRLELAEPGDLNDSPTSPSAAISPVAVSQNRLFIFLRCSTAQILE